MKEKGNLISLFVHNGIVSPSLMRRIYDTGGELVWEEPERHDVLDNVVLRESRPNVQVPYTETAWRNMNSAPIDNNEIVERQRFMESAYDNDAVSDKGARGAWGIMPSAKAEYIELGRGRDGDLNDPRYNRKVRDYMMRRVTRSNAFYPEDTDSVRMGKQLAYYNWGMGNMYKYLKEQERKGVDTRYSFDWLEELPEETRNYVNFILRNRDINEHKNQEEYERLRDRYYSEHSYSAGGHLYDGSSESSQYLETLDDYVSRNPMGIWEDTPQASEVRKWLYKNAPDRMSSYYFSLQESDRKRINPKFVPDSIQSEDIKRRVSDAVSKFGSRYAAPVVLGLGAGALGQAAAPIIIKTAPALRHTAQVLMNPVRARTAAGALASTVLNSYGITTGIEDAYNVAGRLIKGEAVPFKEQVFTALENTPAGVGRPVGEFISRGVSTLNMIPKHFYIKHRLQKSPKFTDDIERIRENTIDYNIGREKSNLISKGRQDKTELVSKGYKDVLGKPKNYGNGFIGTDVKLASFKDEIENIWQTSFPGLGETSNTALHSEITLYPGQFRLFSFLPDYWKSGVPETLAHEFQHRAQAVMGVKDFVRPKLNAWIPTEITPAEAIPRWGIPDINNPAYPALSVLEGKGRDAWIQSPNEVDSEMALLRERFRNNVPFSRMTPKQQKKAVSYISKQFELSKQDTENLLEEMSVFHYKYGGKLNKFGK